MKEEYYCFTIPECATAIDTYLDFRIRLGEKLTDDSPTIPTAVRPNKC
jgi:hypothetical protein